MSKEKAYILLADGTLLEGYSVGAKGTTIGEICFAVGGSVGYQETLTDPSFCGQIVVQTFPMVGNYGINEEDNQSDKCFLSGYIMREYCEAPSNFRCTGTISDYLQKHKVIGVYGVDTRALTRRIRQKGKMKAMITTEPMDDTKAALKEIEAFRGEDFVKTVSFAHTKQFIAPSGSKHVVVYNFGITQSVLEDFKNLGCSVTLVPYDTSAEEIKELNADGIVFSDGPGDPSNYPAIVENIKQLLQLNLPVFAYGLGHQLLALAKGGKRVELSYRHRSENLPVLDKKKNQILLTTQNCGFVIDTTSIEKEVGEVTFVNINDQTCQGIEYKNIPAFSVQFIPQTSGGSRNCSYLFDDFKKLMENQGGSR